MRSGRLVAASTVISFSSITPSISVNSWAMTLSTTSPAPPPCLHLHSITSSTYHKCFHHTTHSQLTVLSTAEYSFRRLPPSAFLVDVCDSTMWFVTCGWPVISITNCYIRLTYLLTYMGSSLYIDKFQTHLTCPVWNWLSTDHSWQERSHAGGQKVGLTLRHGWPRKPTAKWQCWIRTYLWEVATLFSSGRTVGSITLQHSSYTIYNYQSLLL